MNKAFSPVRRSYRIFFVTSGLRKSATVTAAVSLALRGSTLTLTDSGLEA